MINKSQKNDFRQDCVNGLGAIAKISKRQPSA